MPLPDEHTGMMNGLCQTLLKHNCLQATLKEILHSQSQNIIKLVLTLLQKPITVHPPEKRLTLKDPTGVLLVKGQKHPCIVTDSAQGILNPPELSLATQPILSHQLQLSIQTLLLIRTTRLLERLAI